MLYTESNLDQDKRKKERRKILVYLINFYCRKSDDDILCENELSKTEVSNLCILFILYYYTISLDI